MKDQRIYLSHILECIAAIRRHTGGSRDAFLKDRKTEKAVLRELQELAATSQRLDPALREQCPEIPWQDIAGFRNVLVHDYLGLNLHRIWTVVERDLPPLEEAVTGLLESIDS